MSWRSVHVGPEYQQQQPLVNDGSCWVVQDSEVHYQMWGAWRHWMQIVLHENRTILIKQELDWPRDYMTF